MRSRRSKESVMRRARPISVLMFVLLLAALPLACTGGITGLGPSCFDQDEEDFPTSTDCNPIADD